MSRRLFLWKKQVEQQKEKVGDMRIKNEALVYNILPPHVAVHFLGKKKKDEVRGVNFSNPESSHTLSLSSELLVTTCVRWVLLLVLAYAMSRVLFYAASADADAAAFSALAAASSSSALAAS